MKKRIFEKLFTIAEVSNLTKEEYMQYERSLMAKWDDYAIKKTLKEEGKIEGIKEEKENLIKNLLADGEFAIPKIASLVGVSEDFVREVKKNIR